MTIRSINSIVDEINNRIAGNYPNEVLYNVAVLQPDRNGVTFPMTRENSDQGIQISPRDPNGLIFYHRVLAPAEVKPLEGAKGLRSYQLVLTNMRLVGVGYRKNITSSNDWNNQDIANDAMRILGDSYALSNKETLQVAGRAVTDKLEVLNTEFEGNEDIAHRALDLIAFYVDYQIQQRQICSAPQPDGITQVTAFLMNQTTYDSLTPNSNFYYLIDNDIP